MADSQVISSLTYLTKKSIKKGNIIISNITEVTNTSEINYKYFYVERKSTLITPGYEQFHRTTVPLLNQHSGDLIFELTVKNNLNHSINSGDFSPVLTVNGKRLKTSIG